MGHSITNCVIAAKNGGADLDFKELLKVTATLPKYVADRYSESGLSKVQCGRVLMDCQFIAGEAVRYLTQASVREVFEEQNEQLI